MTYDYLKIINTLREAFEKGDLDKGLSLHSQDVIFWDVTLPEPLRGWQALRESEEVWVRAFSDTKMELGKIVGLDRDVVVEWIMRATNTGPLQMGSDVIPATGKRIELRGVMLGKLNAEGLIEERREYFDTGAFMTQLGLLPVAKVA